MGHPNADVTNVDLYYLNIPIFNSVQMSEWNFCFPIIQNFNWKEKWSLIDTELTNELKALSRFIFILFVCRNSNKVIEAQIIA